MSDLAALPSLAVPVVAPSAGSRRPGRRALARAGLLIAPATLLANVLGYAFNVVVSRALGPDGYGALGALLGLALIGAVPALALQAVVARRTADAAPGELPAVVARLLRASLVLGVATTGLLALAAVPVSAYLSLGAPGSALWLAVSLAPLALVSALQGVLQGRERFGRLAVLFVAAAGLRLLGGAVAVADGGGAGAVLASTAAGSLVAAGVGLLLVRPVVPAAAPGPGTGLVAELAVAAGGLLSLITLANLDVLLARHSLPAREAGLYAVGAVLAKAAFWAPQVVVVVALPRLGGESGPRVLRAALLLVGGCGAVLVAGTLLLADPLVPLVFGDTYAPLARTAWAFTALGATLAVAQVLVFRGIATRSGRLGALVAAAAVVEAVVISTVLHDSLAEVVGTALACALVLVAVGGVLSARTTAPPAAPTSARP